MSWLARSIVNSLRGEEDEDDPLSKTNEGNPSKSPTNRENEQQAEQGKGEEDEDPTRGVKEDISELTKTLARQFWGVASFLAPPPDSGDPPPPDHGQSSDPGPGASDEGDAVTSPRLAGIRSDLAEIGGRFKSGISMLSSTKAVSEISKIASTFLPFGSEEDEEGESEEVDGKYEGGAVGVTDEVLAFARNISMHPETWLNFPLIPDEEESDEFDMSDVQQEHALAIEHLEPELAELRIELCPSHMSEGRFWKIYFVLLHSILNRPDAELLTTPQIEQARTMLLQDSQIRTKPRSMGPGSGSAEASPPNEEASVLVQKNDIPLSKDSADISLSKTLTIEEPSTSVSITEIETEKHPVETTEVKTIDKSVIEEDLPVPAKSTDFSIDASNVVSTQKDEEDVDDWLEEDDTGEAGGTKGSTVPLGNDEDVSFSDLEDEDEATSKSLKTETSAGDSRLKDPKEGWIQLKSSEGAANSGNSTSPENKESSDWLSIDDLDDV